MKGKMNKKNIIAIVAVIIILAIFGSFLFSLGEKSTTTTTPTLEDTQGTLINPQALKEVGINQAQKYDYNSAPNNTEQDNSQKSTENENNQAPIANTQDTTTPSAQDNTNSANTASNTTKASYLYCDSFTDEQKAQATKAMIAFEGTVAEVINKNNSYTLKLGPFESREKAKEKFNKLGQKSIVSRCTLVDE